MDNNQMFNVKNRSASMAVYTIPEDNIRREFMPGETKIISFGELMKLTYQPGGREIMANFLQIEAVEATEVLGIKREPEYDMSEEQIIDLIQNGSYDAFLDALDFAPIGVIDLIKTFAVKLPMNDSKKREALKNKTGFDVSKALANIAEEEEKPVEAEKPAARRVSTTTGTARRTSTQYKIVNKDK